MTNIKSTLKIQKVKMPPNLQNSKFHKRLNFNGLVLV